MAKYCQWIEHERRGTRDIFYLKFDPPRNIRSVCFSPFGSLKARVPSMFDIGSSTPPENSRIFPPPKKARGRSRSRDKRRKSKRNSSLDQLTPIEYSVRDNKADSFDIQRMDKIDSLVGGADPTEVNDLIGRKLIHKSYGFTPSLKSRHRSSSRLAMRKGKKKKKGKGAKVLLNETEKELVESSEGISIPLFRKSRTRASKKNLRDADLKVDSEKDVKLKSTESLPVIKSSRNKNRKSKKSIKEKSVEMIRDNTVDDGFDIPIVKRKKSRSRRRSSTRKPKKSKSLSDLSSASSIVRNEEANSTAPDDVQLPPKRLSKRPSKKKDTKKKKSKTGVSKKESLDDISPRISLSEKFSSKSDIDKTTKVKTDETPTSGHQSGKPSEAQWNEFSFSKDLAKELRSTVQQAAREGSISRIMANKLGSSSPIDWDSNMSNTKPKSSMDSKKFKEKGKPSTNSKESLPKLGAEISESPNSKSKTTKKRSKQLPKPSADTAEKSDLSPKPAVKSTSKDSPSQVKSKPSLAENPSIVAKSRTEARSTKPKSKTDSTRPKSETGVKLKKSNDSNKSSSSKK